MDTVRSKDGTRIAYQRNGTGPPLVLIHGILGSSIRWPVLSPLEEHFTVYAVERRGRGASGDAEGYMLQREFEDIAAVVDSIDTAVNLIGHSFGGLGVLEAALLTPNVRRLIAYEPGPVPTPPNEIERLQKRLDDGDREGMITTFLSEVVQMPAYELDLLKASPVFPAMVMAAPTVPRELRAEQMYQFEPERFQQLTIPTLLLVGGDSPHVSKATVETWHTCLPNSHLVELLGQQHIAHYTAPDLFAREVVMFLADSAL